MNKFIFEFITKNLKLEEEKNINLEKGRLVENFFVHKEED